MPSYIITGNCDDACAKLKTTLRASDAGFDARLQATFKTKAKPAAQPVMPQRAPARSAAPAREAREGFGSGSSVSLTRRADDGSNMRSRLRGSLRG